MEEWCLIKHRVNFYFYLHLLKNHGSRDGSVGTATSYRLDVPGSIPGRGKLSLFSTASRLAVRPTQCPSQRVPGAPSQGGEAAGT
jgi:hypothetical protein